MRFPVLIMSLHLAVLSLFPCQDLPAATGEPMASEAPTGQDAPAHHDDCTPFCICSCCGTLVTGFSRADAPTESQVLPPAGRTHPEYSPSWNPLLAVTRLAQPPRS